MLARAELHATRWKPYLSDVAHHLGWKSSGGAARRLRQHLGRLTSARLVTTEGPPPHRAHTQRWATTPAGLRWLASASPVDLPESPQHRRWRQDRDGAAWAFDGVREQIWVVIEEVYDQGRYRANVIYSRHLDHDNFRRRHGSLSHRPPTARPGEFQDPYKQLRLANLRTIRSRRRPAWRARMKAAGPGSRRSARGDLYSAGKRRAPRALEDAGGGGGLRGTATFELAMIDGQTIFVFHGPGSRPEAEDHETVHDLPCQVFARGKDPEI